VSACSIFAQIFPLSGWCRVLARIFHESLAATTDMPVLPSVLGCRPLRRTVQVRKPTPCGFPVARPPRLSEQARDPPATARHERAGGGQAGSQFLRARCAPLSPASGFPVSWSRDSNS
jgi:hypothetical protein